MNVAKIQRMDVINGDGFRTSLFVSGCARNCKGCFNKQAQNPDYGIPFTDEVKEKLFKEIGNKHCAGLSILGGDPLSKLSDNRKQIIELCKEAKERFPEKSIFIWTGYTIDDIIKDDAMRPIVDVVDVIIDGPFVESLKDIDLKWRGSSNQNIIYTKDIRKQLKDG